MKYFNYLLLCIVALTTSVMFVSCEECGLDEAIESNSFSANNALVGTWKSAGNSEYLVICNNGTAYNYDFKDGLVEEIHKYNYTYSNGTLTMASRSNPATVTSMNVKSLTKNQLVVEEASNGKTYDGVISGPCSIAYLEGNCQK